jgi:uncharacterized protein
MNEARIPYPFVAFAGDNALARGDLASVAVAVQRAVAAGEARPIVVLDASNSQVVDLDLRGSEADVAARVSVQPKSAPDGETAEVASRSSGPGRPRLGVVSREVSLLPRHWDWLKTQRGGASAALRRLVDDARRNSGARDRFVAAQEAVDRYLRVMAGDRPHYEESLRAFYAGREGDLAAHSAAWPPDVRAHLEVLLQRCRESRAP